jgi:hypothetical protein
MVPPFGQEGHHFFQNADGWSPVVEGFLREKHLLPLAELLPEPPAPAVPPPAGLSERGRTAFHTFLIMGPAKAFAAETDGLGGWGMAWGQWDQGRADRKAVENCEKVGTGRVCAVVSRGK